MDLTNEEMIEAISVGIKDAFSEFLGNVASKEVFLEIIHHAIVQGICDAFPIEKAISDAIKDGTEQALGG